MGKGLKKPLRFLVYGERSGFEETDYYYYTNLKDAVKKAEELEKEDNLIALYIISLEEQYVEVNYF